MTTSSLTNINNLSALLQALYAGPLETIPWQYFLQTIRTTLNADGAILILRHPSEHDFGAMITDGFPELGQKKNTLYSENLYTLDPFVNLPAGKVVTLQEHIGSDELSNSAFYQQALQPFGIFHLLGIDIYEPGGFKASFRLSRRAEHKPFDQQQKDFCALLIPHLQQAITIHSRLNELESERSLYASAVGQMSVATLLLNDKQQVIKTNGIAKQLLAQKDGVKLRANKLELDNNHANTQLREIINKALQEQPSCSLVQAMSVPRTAGKSPLGLIIRPIPINEWAEDQSNPTIAIFISDPEQKSQASQHILSQLFNLTAAESRLALLLANGLSLDEAVAKQNISRNTGRAHLRSIFAKTEVKQQTQLVSLILKSVASLG
ncbi:helix-turn-helix transcriptional regulator [Oceanicoccus sp. KOV_DT_Chl]|uniref:helix-turn-helix transcriptional regulator n=1 Tax=Oceanicoccus sp. KOV_DT_Chl TaxID=1904639 RepID=UPI000C7BC185|nr:helix-turn-helix transcriptional regulator [Oceanicoccus sp. KOV_DT_Chl]